MTNRLQAVGNNPFARWLADDSFPPHDQDIAAFRYKGMIWFAPVFGGGCVALMLSILAMLHPARDFGGYVGIPIFAWAATSIVWLVTVTSAVRVRPEALIVDNMVIRHVIPWERFRGLFVETGMGMFVRLDDDAVVQSSSFGRNLADAMKGYDHMRVTLEQIRGKCTATRQSRVPVHPPPDYQRLINVPWRLLLGLLVFFEAFSWIAFALHGG
jgi:hypothetical protein